MKRMGYYIGWGMFAAPIAILAISGITHLPWWVWKHMTEFAIGLGIMAYGFAGFALITSGSKS